LLTAGTLVVVLGWGWLQNCTYVSYNFRVFTSCNWKIIR